jgi:hypothetical protein
MMKKWKMAGIALVGLLFTAACQDLEIENPNNPDRTRAITRPADVEGLVYGSWGLFTARTQNSGSCYNTFPTIADEGTATYANSASLELSSEPRVIYNNASSAAAHDLGRYQWYDWYSMLSNANDALIAMDSGLEIVDADGDRTLQTRGVARFLQGLSLGYIGLIFDQAIVATEETDITDPDNLTFRPYSEVIAAAVASLERSIQIASTQNWSTDQFLQGRSFTAEDLVHASHSFIAKFQILGARSRAERDALPWASILSHIDAGMDALGDDFWVDLDQNGLTSSYRYRIQNNGSFQQRADYYTVGMADVTGAFQSWFATPLGDRNKFDMDSPDRRVIGPDGPTSDGKYFEHLENEYFRPERGTYHFSYYQFDRFNEDYYGGSRCPDCRIDIIMLDEMTLFRAEAALRTGNKQLAADLINVTRVGNGELPPVTADGVPQAADCVPKTSTGQCGSLELALFYERMIELYGQDCQRAFHDKRGFDMLTPGTLIHLPVPGRELETLGFPVYTFGGVGGTDSSTGWALW